MKKSYVEPIAEAVSFLSCEAMMSCYVEGDIGGLTPGAGGRGDF